MLRILRPLRIINLDCDAESPRVIVLAEVGCQGDPYIVHKTVRLTRDPAKDTKILEEAREAVANRITQFRRSRGCGCDESLRVQSLTEMQKVGCSNPIEPVDAPICPACGMGCSGDGVVPPLHTVIGR